MLRVTCYALSFGLSTSSKKKKLHQTSYTMVSSSSYYWTGLILEVVYGGRFFSLAQSQID